MSEINTMPCSLQQARRKCPSTDLQLKVNERPGIQGWRGLHSKRVSNSASQLLAQHILLMHAQRAIDPSGETAKPTSPIITATSIALHRLPVAGPLCLVGVAAPLVVPPVTTTANIVVVLLVAVAVALLSSISAVALLQGAVLARAVS